MMVKIVNNNLYIIDSTKFLNANFIPENSRNIQSTFYIYLAVCVPTCENGGICMKSGSTNRTYDGTENEGMCA